MAYDRKPNQYGPAKTEPVVEEPAPPPREELPPIQVSALPRQAFAGIPRRLMAFVLDCIVVIPTALLVAWPMGTLPFLFDRAAEEVGVFGLAPTTAKLITNLLLILLYDIYFAGTVHAYGYTLGMSMFSIAVVDKEGRKPTKSTARWRYYCVGLVLLPLGLGLLSILWDKQKRGWHDRIVGTWCVHAVVIKRNMQNAGREPKLEPPITRGVLLFLPGMICAVPVLVLFGLTMRLLVKLRLIKPN